MSKYKDYSYQELMDIMKGCKIFSRLEHDALTYLAQKVKVLVYNKGEIIFRQGEAAGALFILTSGRLVQTISLPNKVIKEIGTINTGETIGELTALTKAPHAVTVKAIYDSEVLELSHQDYREFTHKYPSAVLRVLIDYVASREAKLVEKIINVDSRRIIAIVAANENNIDNFLHDLNSIALINHKILFLNESKEHHHNDAYWHNIISKAERENKVIAVILHPGQNYYPRAILDHIDTIYFIADVNGPAFLGDFARDILSKARFHFVKRHELVLLHKAETLNPQGTSQWLKLATFAFYHHVRMGDQEHYRRLLNFMSGKAVTLVLGGGGSKGWVHMGVIKALSELGITIDAIGGTSIGAVAGACFALSKDYQEIFDRFSLLGESLRSPFAFKNYTWPAISLLSTKRSTTGLKNMFAGINIEDLWLPYFCVSCNLNLGQEVVARAGDLWTNLRATTSLPGFMPPLVENGEMHVDGGLLNNLPVNVMKANLDGLGTTIAVSLGNRKKTANYNFPPIMPFTLGLMARLKPVYKDTNIPPFFDTLLRSLLVGASSKEEENSLLADILIKPDLQEYSSLNPSLKLRAKFIEMGYTEALAKFTENKDILNLLK